ncbi:hypothetical protein H310_03822 [Aphanomyces invadans]|uniref:Uncharacterized protein n=1 Tax=Aphanomyces invadans TaxID=157072 RepID=A0A024UDY5_9STRA|nr:hypothetical protein H310_03822 [Aphanomyces invadans]ETW04631.1 hypothetical protein H310_03822 [Aphanomyces invadans]|eukprot:XP_008866069.1 hypothetical protein H310_03822 [Aphanomyces invadans]
MADPSASSFIDDVATIVCQPGPSTDANPNHHLASAKQLNQHHDDKQRAAVYPRRTVLPAGFWTRVVNPVDVPSSTSSTHPTQINSIVPPLADAVLTLETKDTRRSMVEVEEEDGASAILYDYPPTELSSLWTMQGDGVKATTAQDPILPPSAATVVVHGWVESYGEDSGISDGDGHPATPTSAGVDAAMLHFVDSNVDEKDAEIERLTKQNVFLVQLLRKVTAKVMKNRTDLAFYRKKLRDAMRPVPKPATADISIQTSDDEPLPFNRDRNPVDAAGHQIESLTWQLKVASAKIHSLTTCLDEAKARLEANSTSTCALTGQYEAEAAKWKAQLTNAQAQASAHRTSLVKQEALSSVLCEYVGRCGVPIDPSMDAKAAEALLQPHTVVRRTHLAAADSMYDRLTDSMARELTFLSKLDALDPTDMASCQNLCKQPIQKTSRWHVERR